MTIMIVSSIARIRTNRSKGTSLAPMAKVGKGLLFALWGAIIWPASADDSTQKVPSGCALPSVVAGKRVFYVDPIRGSMTNNGSANAPWSTLHDVFERGLFASKIYKQPYQPNAVPLAANTNAVIHPGDVVYLRSGDHGDVGLTGVNDDFVTIEAEPGQTPVIGHLKTFGASRWIIRGITFRSDSGGWLVEFLNHNSLGPSDNIVFEMNDLLSRKDVSAWTAKDWTIFGMNGIKSQATCATIRNNRLTNVRNGIMVEGAGSLIDGNTIDYFADDGIDILVGNVSIIGNRITNNLAIGDGNHNDGIQGWTVGGAVNDNVLIADNVIIHSTDPSLPFPGELQGIAIFDGKWEQVTIRNNRVVTNHWHGITVFGVKDSVIESNRVIGTDPKRTTWIDVENMKAIQGGSPPRNVSVRNNVATYFRLPNDSAQVLSEGNKCYEPKNQTGGIHGCGLR